MIALIIATIAVASFSLLLRLFQQFGVDSFKAILINYAVAFVWGYFLSMHSGFVNPFHEKWFWMTLVLGLIFIRGMVLLDFSTKKIGVAISTVCSRASMVLTIIFCYLAIPGSERPRWLAIILALLALVLIICTDMRSVVHGSGKKWHVVVLAFVVFLIFGVSNSLLKWVQYVIDETYGAQGEDVVNQMNACAMSIVFITALLIGIGTEIYKRIRSGQENTERKRMTWREVLGGFVLGSANFFGTYLLVVAMKDIDSSVLFPIHNAGIVALGAIVAWIAFGEKLSKTQIFGIIVSIVAIAWLCV